MFSYKESIRQAASLSDFQYSLISISRQTLTPVEKQNRDKTAICKSEGTGHFWEQVPGLPVSLDHLQQPLLCTTEEC